KLQRGQPRSYCFDQFCCVDKPRTSPSERYPLKYTRVPEVQSHFHAYNANSTWTAHGSDQTILRPSPPIFVQSQLRPSVRPFVPLSQSTPLAFRRPTQQPDTSKDNSETLYDEVHNSIYTTVNPLERNLRSKTLRDRIVTPGLTTPDGQKWMLAPSGQFYLPHSELPADKINRRDDHRLPEPPSEVNAWLIDLKNPNNSLQPQSTYQSIGTRTLNTISADERNGQFFAAPVQENKIQVQRENVTNTTEVGYQFVIDLDFRR
ncbi:uncharacterized protein DEA37_0011373, partial [Paragonimus westermani]